jgi:hypothetical protein
MATALCKLVAAKVRGSTSLKSASLSKKAAHLELFRGLKMQRNSMLVAGPADLFSPPGSKKAIQSLYGAHRNIVFDSALRGQS